MSPRGKSLSIGALAGVIGLLTGVVGGTVKAMAYTEDVATKAVKPVRDELHAHLESVQEALKPGGAMHDFRVRAEERDAYLVDAIAALCAANPRAACPAPGRLVSNGNGR